MGVGEISGGILAASANNMVKYTAQITLSAANPAAKTEEKSPELQQWRHNSQLQGIIIS